MKFEKFINENGDVAVLVSESYGFGWSSEETNDTSPLSVNERACFLSMDKTLVEMYLRNASEDEVASYILTTINEDIYMGGWECVTVKWLPKNTVFKIDNYDGAETILLLEHLCMTA